MKKMMYAFICVVIILAAAGLFLNLTAPEKEEVYAPYRTELENQVRLLGEELGNDPETKEVHAVFNRPEVQEVILRRVNASAGNSVNVKKNMFSTSLYRWGRESSPLITGIAGDVRVEGDLSATASASVKASLCSQLPGEEEHREPFRKNLTEMMKGFTEKYVESQPPIYRTYIRNIITPLIDTMLEAALYETERNMAYKRGACYSMLYDKKTGNVQIVGLAGELHETDYYRKDMLDAKDKVDTALKKLQKYTEDSDDESQDDENREQLID